MLKGLGNLAEMMKRVGRMRGEMERIGEELKQLEVEGAAAGGLVRIRINGKQEAVDCKIDPQVFRDGDHEMLEDLVMAALNQAMEKARSAAADKVAQLSGSMNLAGFNLPIDLDPATEAGSKDSKTD